MMIWYMYTQQMITMVKLINISIYSHLLTFSVRVSEPVVYSPSNFPIFDMELLIIIIMLYLRSLAH